jgi:hypothetical protein
VTAIPKTHGDRVRVDGNGQAGCRGDFPVGVVGMWIEMDTHGLDAAVHGHVQDGQRKYA